MAKISNQGNMANGGVTPDQPQTQPVPQQIKNMGYEYWEDFDVNGDGIINVTDIISINNQGFAGAGAYAMLIIDGNVLPPPRRNPLGGGAAMGGAVTNQGVSLGGPGGAVIGGGPGGSLTPSLTNQAAGGRPGGRQGLGGPDARVSGVGSPAQAQQTAAIQAATAGGNSTNYPLDTREFADKITDTVKVTAGYFTGLDGDLDGNEIYTMSMASSNEKYYSNICQVHPTSGAAETQFAVTYGHYAGSGSNTYGSTDNIGALEGTTEAIYKQLATILLAENEVTGGFKISQGGSAAKQTGRDEYIWALIGKRVRFKDRINKKNWTLNLSGSATGIGATAKINMTGSRLTLTDDSAVKSATSTVAGPRYNIVSGAAGTVKVPASTTTYGHFYPEVGIMVFSGAELSASIPGNFDMYQSAAVPSASFSHLRNTQAHLTHSGFTPILDNHGGVEPTNHLKFVTCLVNNNTSDAIVMRSEEDQTQINYFCRVKAAQGNFSNNPTFVSGSSNMIRNTNMRGNPTVYITGLGLNSDRGELVAVAKLSTPIKKNFSSEATIKVKLTY